MLNLNADIGLDEEQKVIFGSKYPHCLSVSGYSWVAGAPRWPSREQVSQVDKAPVSNPNKPTITDLFLASMKLCIAIACNRYFVGVSTQEECREDYLNPFI